MKEVTRTPVEVPGARCDYDYGDRSHWCLEPVVELTQVVTGPSTNDPDMPTTRRTHLRCASHPTMLRRVEYWWDA